MALRTVGVRLAAEVTGYRNQLLAASRSTRDFTGELDKAAKAGKLDKVADSAGRMGLGLAAAFAGVVAVTAKFDKQMSEVGAVSGATADQMGKLRQAALDAGKATSFSASEAAQAEAELAKAGISTADILGGALSGSLNLAAAGTLDLAEAADISAKTMNIFKLSGQDVGHIADVLAAAANKSATDVHEMGEALKMGGLAAQASGMSLEETAGTLAAFADNALNGSDAGTSLKTALMMLQAPSGKAAGTMKELGINAYDAAGNFIGTAKLAGVLQKALGGLTQEQRNAALATIFGADGMRAANVLYGLGEQGIRDYITAVDDQGAAAETARKKTDNLAGDVERLTGSLETLAIQAGSGANGGLRTLVQSADALVGAFSDLPGPVQSTLTVIAGVGGVSLLAVAGLIKLKSTAGDAMQALRDIGPAGEKAAVGIGRATSALGKAGAVGVALLLAYEGAKAFSDWASRNAKPTQVNVEGMAKSLQDLARSGKATGELEKVFGKDLSGIASSMRTLSTAQSDLKKATEDFVPVAGRGMTVVNRQAEELQRNSEDAKAAMAGLDEGLAKLASEGGATQAKIAFEQLSAQFGVSLDQLPKYRDAAGQAATANSGLAKGFGDVGANARTMNGSLAEAVEKGQTLIDVWNQLHGASLSFDQAQLKTKDAIDAVAKSFKDNGKAIEGNSRAAVENRVKIGEAAQAAADAAQKKYEETGSVTDATKVYGDYIGALKKTLHSAGLTDAQIATLIATYAKMPSSVTTTVNAKTGTATSALAGFIKRVNTIDGRVITVHTRITRDGEYIPGQGTQTRRWGGVTEHAQTGLLREAAVYSAKGPARYAFAEPATGGEAFIPKRGDAGRSLGILNKAASWYGAQVWRGGAMPASSGGVQRVEVIVRPAPGVDAGLMRELMRGLRYEIKTVGGGDVQKALGRN